MGAMARTGRAKAGKPIAHLPRQRS